MLFRTKPTISASALTLQTVCKTACSKDSAPMVSYSLSLYDSGIEIGPRYRFHSNGQTNFEYHFLGGLTNGTSISYHANGVISSTTVYQAGVINGAMRNYDEEGRITLSAYRHMGENCGTWTSTTYDSNGIAKSFQTEYPLAPLKATYLSLGASREWSLQTGSG